ncbi:hypothetical protein PESP_a1206 [Pseudoalteromonas espejiana DSM 9414]|uniref:Spore coat protein U domain-containing protein n=1 Tax=Pseudoalteromonas espejiana TaxID=28107 RepID=A0A510Y045_9GAMM|nr:hypothetical protein [Pseudoalteromonas espejiana]ASM49354.1 hypothetical protein PESP_a1206 [Pseudoalteromonas espejiana DSM 9414]GEK56087.1 hypothetical protein PES01_29320 [Pseudoalteromonas espejiana]
MFIKIIYLTISVFFLSVASRVHAQCDASIGEIEYLFDNLSIYKIKSQVDAEKTIRVDTINTTDCTLYFSISSQNQGYLKSTSQLIDYQIRLENQLLSSTINQIKISNNKVDISLVIPAGTPVKSGYYTDRLQLKLYDVNKHIVDEKEIEIETNIEPRTSLSLLGYNTFSNTVYLGELKPTEKYTMFPSLQIVTNTDIQLNISSENKGRLIHSIFSTKYGVNYTLQLGGEEVNLAKASSLNFSYSGQTEFFIPLSIQLEDFKDQAAGEYSDVIRFQISPLNY